MDSGQEAQAGVERGFPSGAVRPTHGQIDVWASKQSAFLGGSYSCYGLYARPAKESCSLFPSLPNDQAPPPMPGPWPGTSVQTRKDKSLCEKSSESGGKQAHTLSVHAGDGELRTGGK